MANDSTLKDTAEAVKDALNDADAGTFDEDFTAVRAYAPAYSVEQLKTLRVTVVPKGLIRVRGGRRTDQIDPAIDVAIQKTLVVTDDDAPGTIDNDEVDSLMELTEAIADYLRKQRLQGYSAAMGIAIENDPAWSQDHMATKRVFTSVVTVTMRRYKDLG